MNFLRVFDHFVELTLKILNHELNNRYILPSQLVKRTVDFRP